MPIPSKDDPSEARLSLENVSRSVGEKSLLSGVTLRLRDGETLGITGLSGCGKSTLLRVLAKLDPLQSGTLKYQGVPVEGDDIPGFRRQVAYLPQRPSMVVGTVAENLFLSHHYSSHSTTPSRGTKKISTWIEMDDAMLAQDAATLSGGQQQRVALERVLQMNPTVLLLDEPTASLDRTTAKEVEGRLQAWRNENSQRSWIWVSHDRDQLDRVCQTILTMHNGQLSHE